MSQTTLTNFFQVKKKLPDQHAAKRRKVVVDAPNSKNEAVKLKDDVPPTLEEPQAESLLVKPAVLPAPSVEKEEPTAAPVEQTASVITSAIDDHSDLFSKATPSTPSSCKESVNERQSKRRCRAELDLTPKSSSEATEQPVRFSMGSGESTAKKSLKLAGKPKGRAALVPFTKAGNLSPKKKEPVKMLDQNVVPKSFNFAEKAPSTPTKRDFRDPKTPRQVAKSLFGDSADSEKETFKEPQQPASTRAKVLAESVAEVKKVSEKLTPAEVKRLLGKRGKLKDVKERLSKLTEETRNAHALKENAALKVPRVQEDKIALEVVVPASPSKLLKSPMKASPAKSATSVKASPQKVPAYQRYAYLTGPVQKSLPLPYNYRLLAEVFRCTDTVVSMLFNRKEMINYTKLARSVQDMMRKNFGEKFLKQIKCVFPQAYFFAWEKIMGKFGQKKEEYELRITPNLKYKTDLRTSLEADRIPPVDEAPNSRLGPEMMVERRNIFHNSLLQMVKDQHREFLSSLDPPIHVKDDMLTRWHKEFDLESCQEIDTSELPVKPRVEKFTTAKQVLEKAIAISNINPRLGNALQQMSENIAEKQDDDKKPIAGDQSQPAEAAAPPAAKATVPKELKGLNAKLLEKIRAKEAEKARVEMTRRPAQTKKITQLRRCQTHARSIRSLFIGEKKPSLEIKYAVNKLTFSYPGHIEAKDVEEDIQLMASELNNVWLTIHNVRNVQYIKIDMKKDINQICQLLEQKLKAAEKS